MSIADEFPLAGENQPESTTATQQSTPLAAELKGSANLHTLWAQLSDFGLVEPVVRYGTHLLAIALAVAVIWAMRHFYLNAQVVDIEFPQRAVFAAPPDAEDVPIGAEDGDEVPELPALISGNLFAGGIPRFALLHTTIPNRPRVDVITYIVQEGDTVFGIAEKYGLKPETIFWGNREVLGDNPHSLRAGQDLNILPVDGTYHKWSAGESFIRVAEFYGVDPLSVVEWPGNPLDVYVFDIDNPQIEPGTWLIVPDGTREFIDWGPPRIPRDNPAVARTYGPGFCGTIVDGAVGVGAFIWPTTATYLSGYDYSPASNHYGIDIAGSTGNPVFAADAGVVVYAGWSNYGYGYLIVLDHGNGWQSLYAHLSAVSVFCGQSVFQGTGIGAVGNTGNSSGAHLHFELMYSTAKVNPWNYVSP
ncbi:MAG: LysM peptidoglycan-binding domain-containing M23 family metallopeptidase [Anaerolineales bacterium]